jgi:hypothetical protein
MIFLWYRLWITCGASYAGLISASLAILGLRDVVGSLAGVIFSSASGKGSSISRAVKFPGF